jgi:hypothetical protein
LRRLLVSTVLLGTCAGLFRISIFLADPLVNRPFDPRWPGPVLLVWPDRVEIRRVKRISEVSPRPPGAGYTFLVPAERRSSIERQVRDYPSPKSSASWLLKVKQETPASQRIQLELFGNGIGGMVYEARADSIVPLYSRLTGPGFAFIVGGVWVVLQIAVWLLWRTGAWLWGGRTHATGG